MKLVFDTFSPNDITKIVIAMIQARHIFCVSSSASVVCQFAAALPLLIEPFRWSMNTIPVVPLKLKEICQVPVPTLIGLTHAEVLKEGRVAHHIVVNVDLKLVIDNPPLDSHNQDIRFKVLSTQTKASEALSSLLKKWEKSPGFPHKQVSMLLNRFIASYLQIYTGPVSSPEEMIKALSKLPEFLESSQVMQDLLNREHAPENVIDAFENWFDEVFKRKSQKSVIISRMPSKSTSQGDFNLLDVQEIPKKQNMPVSASTPGLNEIKAPDIGANNTSLLIDFLDESPPVSGINSQSDLLLDLGFGSPPSKSGQNNSFQSPTEQPTNKAKQSDFDDFLDLLISPDNNKKSPTSPKKDISISPRSAFDNINPTPQSPINAKNDLDLFDFTSVGSSTPPPSDRRRDFIQNQQDLTSASYMSLNKPQMDFPQINPKPNTSADDLFNFVDLTNAPNQRPNNPQNQNSNNTSVSKDDDPFKLFR